MRVVVIGGTGRTGRLIVEEALAAGHQVCSYGRSATPETVPAGVEAIAGDATDGPSLHRALEGADAVITALSIPRKSPSPFAKVLGPDNLHSRSTMLILAAMVAHDIPRIIKVSAQSVGDSAPRAGCLFKLLVAISNLRPAFADHGIADKLVRRSNRAWTILRPPVLTDNPALGAVEAEEDLRTWSWTKLSRRDVAASAVQALTSPEWERRCLSLGPGEASSTPDMRTS
jgi:uncharacterized protein YbjT (DUF2867 family)